MIRQKASEYLTVRPYYPMAEKSTSFAYPSVTSCSADAPFGITRSSHNLINRVDDCVPHQLPRNRPTVTVFCTSGGRRQWPRLVRNVGHSHHARHDHDKGRMSWCQLPSPGCTDIKPSWEGRRAFLPLPSLPFTFMLAALHQFPSFLLSSCSVYRRHTCLSSPSKFQSTDSGRTVRLLASILLPKSDPSRTLALYGDVSVTGSLAAIARRIDCEHA